MQNSCNYDRNEQGMQNICINTVLVLTAEVFESFLITFVGKTDPSDLFKKEYNWTCVFCTVAPCGLDIEDSV